MDASVQVCFDEDKADVEVQHPNRRDQCVQCDRKDLHNPLGVNQVYECLQFQVEAFPNSWRSSLVTRGNTLLFELQASSLSTAFDRFETCHDGIDHHSSWRQKDKNLQMTGMDWSESSRHWAATFASADTGVLVWGDNVVVETEDPLLCLAAHPTQPTLIAVGNDMGHVIIYEDARCLARSKLHGLPICRLQWTSQHLISLNISGHIWIWPTQHVPSLLQYPIHGINVDKAVTSMYISSSLLLLGCEDGSIIQIQWQSRGVPSKLPGAKMKWTAHARQWLHSNLVEQQRNLVQQVEAFAKHKQRRGVDSRTVWESNLQTPTPLSSYATTLHHPPHMDKVTSIQISPINSNLFLSSSIDIRLHHIRKHHQPLLILEEPNNDNDTILSCSLLDVKFVPGRSSIIATVTESGKVLLFDLNHSLQQPIHTVVIPNNSTTKIQRLIFHKNLLATADNDGSVHLWKIPPSLIKSRHDEEEHKFLPNQQNTII